MSRPTLDPAAAFRFRVRGFHPLWLAFPKPFCYLPAHLCSPNPGDKSPVCPLSLSLAATQEIEFSFFSSGYLDVSVPRVPFHALCIGAWMTVVFTAGFPHSEIHGLQDVCSSPWLIAAYHVLHRLLMPRHSPCALCSLTYLSFVIKTLYNHHKEYLFLACCILYTLIYVQFSKNIERHSLSKLNRNYNHLATIEQVVLFFIDALHLCTR